MALKQIKFIERMDWSRLTFYFFALTVPFIFFPDEVYSHFITFLAFSGTMFGPLSAVYFVDFFVLRRQRLDIGGLYLEGDGKPYYYWGAFNWAGILAVAIATMIYFIILDPLTFDSSTAFLYMTASIPAILLAGVLHYVLSKMITVPKGLGAYGKQ